LASIGATGGITGSCMRRRCCHAGAAAGTYRPGMTRIGVIGGGNIVFRQGHARRLALRLLSDSP
jgi:hypothetical protein